MPDDGEKNARDDGRVKIDPATFPRRWATVMDLLGRQFISLVWPPEQKINPLLSYISPLARRSRADEREE